MKISTWNVNGLRAAMTKGLAEYLTESNPEIMLLQETKLSNPLEEIDTLCTKLGYRAEYSFADRSGYSGTLCLFRQKPKPKVVTFGMNHSAFDNEGRLITLEYDNFYILNCYTPASKGNLERRYFRFDWDKRFKLYIERLLADDKPVIIGGDFNVARSRMDVFPQNETMEKNLSGFTEEERCAFESLLEDCDLIDVFRHLYPDKTGAYTWWSNRSYKRSDNRGWRLDYFLVSKDIINMVSSITIRDDIYGSDHCPVEMIIDLP